MNIERKNIEEWFRETWEKFQDPLSIELFFIRNLEYFSDSFIREFKDLITIKNIMLYNNSDFNFIREFATNNNINCFVEGKNFDEKQVEEFKNYVNWYDIFETNFNITETFIDKWSDKVDYIDKVRNRRYEKMKWDPERRKLVNEEIEQAKEMGLFG